MVHRSDAERDRPRLFQTAKYRAQLTTAQQQFREQRPKRLLEVRSSLWTMGKG